jgi:Exopolysaccharide biosynthesis protein related to N-acetylglucosamine-1-phosphodiester alpha-N-acetylglucosaminidase
MSNKDEIIPDYSEDEIVEPIYENIDDLESVSIPSYKEEIKAEEEDDDDDDDETEEINFEIFEYVAEIKTPLKETINERMKKYSRTLMMISSLFIPGLIVLLVISSHSKMLINEAISNITIVLLGVFIALFIVGLGIFISKIKVKIEKTINNWFKYVYSIFMVVYIIGCFAFLFLLYGPYNNFKDWLVTTAMATMNHQYYCKWFYSEKEIDEVFSRHYIRETGDSTDDSLIKVNNDIINQTSYANKYEEQILKREEGTLYKLIEFEVNGCKAYLAVIYDPSKVSVTTTKYVGKTGQYVTTMAKREKAVVAINGAGFKDPGHSSTGSMPRGITIVNGKIVTNNEYGAVSTGGIIGFTKENKLVLLKNKSAAQALEMGVRDAVSWGPFLIVNGKSAYTSGNGGWGYAARTAIGQREDGIVLLLVVDSNYNRSKGASMVDLTRIMENYGAINATNLDGGTSSVMAINGELINDPIDSALVHQTRPIATSFIVTE